LGKIRGVRVAARTSAYSFRGRQATTTEIGRALNVDTVLDCSLRRAGDRIRISVQLVKVADGLHLWSETYDRTLDDIFAVQDDIARSVVSELRAALVGRDPDSAERERVAAEVAKAARGRSTDSAAHRLCLLGRHFINRLTREDLTRAIDYLKQAIDLDPRFAQAWADLGGAYTRAATWGLIPKVEAIRQAREAVERALAIEPDLPEAFTRLTVIYMFHEWDWKGAESACRRALELAPGDAAALNAAGVLSMVLGRPEESIEYHRRASEQDPLSASPHANLGLSLVRVHRFVEAEAALRRALELAPQRLLSRSILALALVHQGRGEEALAELEREPDEGERLYALAIVQQMLGNARESDAALEELIRAHADHYAVQVAEVYAVRGDADATFEWMEKGYQQRDFGLPEVRGSHAFRPYRTDPRWRAMMARLGFVDEAV
ncbi:MAG TPA: tetratricopeptide repeat protein, partial [Candidatus Eisenbacteria bacterium]|nr:tetratricopeptide repeat protein [Candidatus Eisenbacteria bacterium]